MIELMQETFINVSIALTALIVPIVAIGIGFRLFFAGLYGGKRD